MALPSELRLVKHALEFREQAEVNKVPRGTRGIYVLYKRRGRVHAEAHHYDVVYVGMATRGIRSRLGAHVRRKKELWTHYSAYEVWDNIQDSEIAELEGLFRHLYRFDSRANALNKQKGYRPLWRLAKKTIAAWKVT